MNKQIIIGALVVVAAVAGVAVFKGRGADDSAKTLTPTTSGVADETPTVSPVAASTTPSTTVKSTSGSYATLKEAYNSGKSLKCEISTPSQKFTYYFKDSNIRYEAMSTSGSTKIEAVQIIKKDVAYGWTNMSSDIVTTTDPKTIEFQRSLAFQMDTLLSSSLSSKIQLTCAQTNLSASLFDKPKN